MVERFGAWRVFIVSAFKALPRSTALETRERPLPPGAVFLHAGPNHFGFAGVQVAKAKAIYFARPAFGERQLFDFRLRLGGYEAAKDNASVGRHDAASQAIDATEHVR